VVVVVAEHPPPARRACTADMLSAAASPEKSRQPLPYCAAQRDPNLHGMHTGAYFSISSFNTAPCWQHALSPLECKLTAQKYQVKNAFRSLESSLIGVVEVKLLLIGPRPGSIAPAGHALLFAVGAGPPHDGSGGRGVPICFTTLRACSPQALDSQRDRLAHRPHGNDPVHPVGRVRGASSPQAAARLEPTLGSLPKRNSV
jgi:hypothetical protein